MTDRVLLQEKLRSGPYTHLLTVNPDRLTRRADEVASLVGRIGSGVWWTWGCETEEVIRTEWCAVGETEGQPWKRGQTIHLGGANCNKL